MLTHVQSIQANICAFTTQNTTNTVKFDTDSVEIIIDTGATAAFSHCINDFKTFTCLKSKVNGLGSLTIKGVGTVEYPIINDNNDESFYLSEMHIMYLIYKLDSFHLNKYVNRIKLHAPFQEMENHSHYNGVLIQKRLILIKLIIFLLFTQHQAWTLVTL